MAAKLFVRREDSTWHMSDPAVEVAANEGAVRSKLLTAPWEYLLELGHDVLPPQIPDLRPHVLTPPRTIVVRVRATGLDWPDYQYLGFVDVETPVEPAEETTDEPPTEPETPPDPETPEG